MKNTDIEYIANNDSATTICYLTDGDNQFIGMTTCHPDDMPYASELTGGYIAEGRAIIKMLQHHKNNVIKPQIEVLEHLYGCMKSSKSYNAKSNETRLIRRQLQMKKNELANLRCDIENIKQTLKEYISLKDKQYAKYNKQAENN